MCKRETVEGERYMNMCVRRFQRGRASRARLSHILTKMSSVRAELGSPGSNRELALSGHQGECVMLWLGTRTL